MKFDYARPDPLACCSGQNCNRVLHTITPAYTACRATTASGAQHICTPSVTRRPFPRITFAACSCTNKSIKGPYVYLRKYGTRGPGASRGVFCRQFYYRWCARDAVIAQERLFFRNQGLRLCLGFAIGEVYGKLYGGVKHPTHRRGKEGFQLLPRKSPGTVWLSYVCALCMALMSAWGRAGLYMVVCRQKAAGVCVARAHRGIGTQAEAARGASGCVC